MFTLDGRVALVSGAGQGVGAGIARVLAERGAAIAVNDLHRERADATVEAIAAAGGRAIAIPFDVTNYDAVVDAVAAVPSSLGPIDILVNNAGVPTGMEVKKFLNTVPDDWRVYVELNLFGVMNCCRAIVGGMSERGWGRVITISSGAGTIGMNFGVSFYAAGKGGGIAFMRHLALESAASGVTANTIAVGLIDNHPDPAITAGLAKTIPVGRLGKPEDIGALCVYLASEDASWMTGQTIHLNGGSPTS